MMRKGKKKAKKPKRGSFQVIPPLAGPAGIY